jgi:outer membrane protein assembly factor BamE (lipoprotein component of BamABCDE complex)
MRHPIVFALLAVPALLSAQTGEGTVSPGMTRAQVISALGTPATSRTTNEHTYLYYQNSCGRECGMNDLVILQGDSVVDAIFRSPSRHYTGTSSSPNQATPITAARRRATPRTAVAPKATVAAKPAAAPEPKAPATADAKPAPKTEVKMAEKPQPQPHAAKKTIEVRGTNREVTVPGTKTEIEAPVRMAPTKANDTRPSIPLDPSMVKEPAPTPAPAQKPTS